jgi:hypothetical protein
MELESRVAEWAAAEENVRAAALVGSRARVDVPADEWSDYVRRALFASMDFFRRETQETAGLLGLEYPATEDEFATSVVRELLP